MENLTIKEKLGYGFGDFARIWHATNSSFLIFYKLDDSFMNKINKELTKKREV